MQAVERQVCHARSRDSTGCIRKAGANILDKLTSSKPQSFHCLKDCAIES